MGYSVPISAMRLGLKRSLMPPYLRAVNLHAWLADFKTSVTAEI
jgi:hypothetical protein